MSVSIAEHKLGIWQGITLKSVISGFILAAVMCAANSYLTLKAGVIEEGPIIAALIFTGIFFALKKKVTTTEAMIAATMGSAGGSFGFITNLFAAYKMVGIELTTTQMMFFTLSTGAFSVLMAIPFYYLFIVKETLPWVVGEACANVIKNTVATKDTRQGKIILWFSLLFFGVLMLQGKMWMPEATDFITYGAVGIGLAWSPFFLSAGGLLGLRTGWGFVIGALLLIIVSPYTDKPAAPHKFFYPGVAFLITSGLTTLLLKWRTVVAALHALKSIGGDDGGILPFRWLVGLSLVVASAIVAVINYWFGVPVYLGIIYVVVAGVFLNLVAIRAAGETTFNPVRAMGIVTQGIGALAGAVDKFVNLTGAGVMAGSNNQTGILCQDLYSGWRLKVNPRLQVALQAMVLPVIAIVSVGIFYFLSSTTEISLDNDKLSAPVAKAWAGFALILSGDKLPDNAADLMYIFGAAGIVLAAFENIGEIRRWLPSTTGIGIGLILPIAYSLDFFVGAVIFLILAKKFKMGEETISSVAAAGILGEAAGGLLNGALKVAGIFPAG